MKCKMKQPAREMHLDPNPTHLTPELTMSIGLNQAVPTQAQDHCTWPLVSDCILRQAYKQMDQRVLSHNDDQSRLDLDLWPLACNRFSQTVP